MKKMMKMMVAVACAALTFGLTSCSKSSEDLIIGTWEVTGGSMTYTYGAETETESILEPGTQETMTFREDGTMTTWSKDAEGEEYTGNGTWSIKDEKVTFVYDESDEQQLMSTMTFNIDKLDKKNMELSYNADMQGMKMDVKMSFKKI